MTLLSSVISGTKGIKRGSANTSLHTIHHERSALAALARGPGCLSRSEDRQRPKRQYRQLSVAGESTNTAIVLALHAKRIHRTAWCIPLPREPLHYTHHLVSCFLKVFRLSLHVTWLGRQSYELQHMSSNATGSSCVEVLRKLLTLSTSSQLGSRRRWRSCMCTMGVVPRHICISHPMHIRSRN